MTVTRIVQAISSVHSASMSVRSGKALDVCLDPKHFPKFLAGCMMASGLVGYFAMNSIQQKQWEARDAKHETVWNDNMMEQRMSRNQAALKAMIENAKESSWQENLDNAMEAQEHFMLGSQGREDPKFLARIKERSNEIAGVGRHQWASGE